MTEQILQLLEEYGLPADQIVAAPGFANQVWMSTAHVIRINDGRFIEAFSHEVEILSHLAGVVPVPIVVKTGISRAGSEFIILERLPGTNLQDAWPTHSATERESIISELGGYLATIHAVPIATWMRNPAFDAAIAEGDARNAYHAPPSESEMLVASTRKVRPDLDSTLNDVQRFIDLRMDVFRDDKLVFVHADMHFRNVMVHNGHVSGIIDFEGARPAPIDVELDMLVRWLIDRITTDPVAYRDVLPGLQRSYPGLFAIPDLHSRLEVYELLWQLVQSHHWQPGAKWMSDPGDQMASVLSGAFGTRLDSILPNMLQTG